jgi:hypothetical protein
VGRRFAEHYRGHRVLHDSFFELFGDTLFAAMRSINERGWPKDKPTYIVLFLWFQSMFRIARAADVLALSGYPIDAYAVLRSLKEEAFKTAAVVAGYATKSELLGRSFRLTDRSKEARDAHNSRLRLEAELAERLIGLRSGLTAADTEDLQLWDRLFNLQVHGFRLATAISITRWSTEPEPFSLGPESDESADALYLNRSSELAWLITRMLTFLQLEAKAFGDEWHRRRDLLDASHRQLVTSLEKAIAPAFERFLDFHLPVGTHSQYIERG